jgi:hypothetical protein
MEVTIILKTLAGTLPTAGEILVLCALSAFSMLPPFPSLSGYSVDRSVKCAEMENFFYFPIVHS